MEACLFRVFSDASELKWQDKPLASEPEGNVCKLGTDLLSSDLSSVDGDETHSQPSRVSSPLELRSQVSTKHFLNRGYQLWSCTPIEYADFGSIGPVIVSVTFN